MTHPARDEVSVVICTYTLARWHDLLAALETIRQQTIPPREIIVVVDHHRELLQRVHEQIPDVIAVENCEPHGLSGARNSGIKATRSEFVAFMDEDALAAADWLERIIEKYRDPNVIGVGGAVEPVWLQDQPAWFPEEFNWVVGCSYRGLPQTPAQIRNLLGCNMSFRREVFTKIGGFRTGFGRIGTRPVGCEETEFCIRLNRGWQNAILLYDPMVRVYHKVPEQRACWGYFSARCYGEGQSKALVSRAVGARAGLNSERAYTFRTLPRGVIRGLVDALLHRQPGGLARAVVILAGLGITSAGYVTGTLLHCLPIRQNTDASVPCSDSVL